LSKKLPPIHPGEQLREEFMIPLGLSSNALARALNVTPARINEIVRERRGISADTALRLARFNTQAATSDSSFFRGLASPAAAALLASLVWSATDLGFQGEELPRLVAVLATFITAGAGLLMVSNFRYHSFKKFDLRRRVPFVIMLLVVLVVGVVTVDPPRILLLVAVVYALSGPGQLAVRRLRARRADP